MTRHAMEAPPPYSCGNMEKVTASPTVAELESDCDKSKHTKRTERRTFGPLSNLGHRIKDRYNHNMEPKPSITQVYEPRVRINGWQGSVSVRLAHFPWLITAKFSSTVYIGGKVHAHIPWRAEMYLNLVDLPGQLQRGINLERRWTPVARTQDSKTDQSSRERIVVGLEKRRLQMTSPSRWYYRMTLHFPKEDEGWLERIRPLDLISWSNLEKIEVQYAGPGSHYVYMYAPGRPLNFTPEGSQSKVVYRMPHQASRFCLEPMSDYTCEPAHQAVAETLQNRAILERLFRGEKR